MHVTLVEVLPVVDPAFVAEIGVSEDEYWAVRVAKAIDGGVEIVVAVLVAVEFAAWSVVAVADWEDDEDCCERKDAEAQEVAC